MAELWPILMRAPILAAMITNVRGALAGTVLMAAVLMGCEQTTPVRDVVSRTFTVTRADFKKIDVNTDANGVVNAVAHATYALPEITAEVVAAGTVTAEIDLGSGGVEWSALPLTMQVTEDDETHVVAIQPRYRKGEFVLLLKSALQGTLDATVAVDGYRVRAVVIHGDAADR